MAVVVVDTSVLIDHLRGRSEALARLDGAIAEGQHLVVSVLTKVEVLAGMRSHERSSVRDLLAVLRWIEVDEPIADEAGRMARKYRASHPGVDGTDLVIAATTETVGGTLWTRNVKHFPMFPGLTAPY